MIILIGMCSLGFISCMLCMALPSPARTASAPTSTATEMPADGQEGYFDKDPNGRFYAVLPTKETLEAWESSSNATVASAMALGGFGVAGGTKCLHVGGSFMYMKITILDGPQAGKTGWTSKGSIHRGRL